MRFPLIYLLFCSLAYSQNYHYALEDPKQNQPISLEGSYTLSEAARTSAGVYKGEVLVRTLWSNVEKEPGTHTVEWNGLDDEGNIAAKGNYEIKVVSNNVVYEWLSPIGNTSNTIGGTSILKHLEVIQGMVQVGDYIYYNFGFNEHDPAFSKIHVDDVNTNLTTILQDIHYGLEVKHIATDGTNLYISGHDPWRTAKSSMVFAINLSTENMVSFTNGSPYTLASNHVYTSAFSIMEGGNAESEITGLEVVGDYLYVARAEKDSIYVYDKDTASLEATIANFEHPRELTADGSDLWMISATDSVAKYSLNIDGTINALLLSLTVSEPLAMAVKSDGEVAVTDNSTQQIKIFNSSGTLIETFGQLNGYASSPDVADDKFMFVNPSEPQMNTFLFYQDDGKLWVGDTGNYRTIRFNTNRTVDDKIMYLCFIRSMGVDRNDTSRVFANYLEFDVDIASGDWTYAKNWMVNIDDSKDSEFHRLKWVTTLSNGRTYAVQPYNVTGYWEVVELTSTGLRFTGVTIDKTDTAILTEDWNIRTFTTLPGHPSSETSYYWYEQALTGFDENNNPEWGVKTQIAETGYVTDNDPMFRPTVGWNFPPRADTSTNQIISFEGGITHADYSSNKYHLGATPKNGEGFIWKTAVGTPRNYTGDYPDNGMYDMGNGVNYPGGVVLVKEKSIFWNYHGEFWKDRQTNKFQHVYDNGLLLGIFGKTGADTHNGLPVLNQIGVPEMAGNNIKGDIVKIGNNYYILHGDEGHHGAIHRWKVSGLDSIKELSILIGF